MSPVMLAAGKGHTDIVDMLVDQYNCPLTDMKKVSAFDVLAYQSIGLWCHMCQCLCPAVSVDCHSACSQHLCRCTCGRHFVLSCMSWPLQLGICIYSPLLCVEICAH